MLGPALLLIDPQVDFHPGGSLAVQGATEDAERAAAFLHKHTASIDAVYVTLDSHHKYDISHPTFWQNAAGQAPDPFTAISAADVDSGMWTPVDSELKVGAASFVGSLHTS